MADKVICLRKIKTSYLSPTDRAKLEDTSELSRNLYNAAIEQRYSRSYGQSVWAYDQIAELTELRRQLPEFRRAAYNQLGAVLWDLNTSIMHALRTRSSLPGRLNERSGFFPLRYPKGSFRIKDGVLLLTYGGGSKRSIEIPGIKNIPACVSSVEVILDDKEVHLRFFCYKDET